MTTSKSRSAAQAAVTEHGTDHAHESRVDEMSESDATHLSGSTPWIRPSSLDAPPARPGMVQRWVRRGLRGADDPKNLNRSWREGWRPRDPSTLPESWRVYASFADKNEGMIVVDDLILMEVPQEVLDAKRRAIAAETRKQMEGVEHDLEKAQVPGHPILKVHKTSITHPGRKVRAADDE